MVKAEINIQVGLNMHIIDDIGDALSSLRESISSLQSVFGGRMYFSNYELLKCGDAKKKKKVFFRIMFFCKK